MKTIKRIIIVAVILFVTGFVFSLLFPGNVKLLDDIRRVFSKASCQVGGKYQDSSRVQPG